MASDTIKVDQNKILTLKLSEVFADSTWNTRSGIGETEGGEESENTFKGLKESLAISGQDEPVVVRLNDGTIKGVKQPYFLVAGFRRYRALCEIAAEREDKNPTIKAIAKQLTEADARMLNLRENTAREDLSGPDLVFGIDELLKSTAEAGAATPTDTAIAQSLGLSQGYVSKLTRIVKGVPKAMRNDWRNRTGIKPTVDQMDKISRLADNEEKRAAYEELTKSKEEKARGRNAWIENGKSAMAKQGAYLGKLAREGFILVEDPEALFFDGLELLMKVKDEATDKHRQAFSEAGYNAFVGEYEKDDDTTGSTEKPKKKASKKNGKAEVAEA